MLKTKKDMIPEDSSVLVWPENSVIPAGTRVKRGAYKWNNDAFFIDDFSWLPEDYRNSDFFMGDVANYGVNVPPSNVEEV